MTSSKVTEEIVERNAPIGFFNFAESYWKSAQALQAADVEATHAHSPVAFLYYHAIELYLKAYLRLHGHSSRELAGRQYGHKTCCLSERAAKFGLGFDEEDLEVFSLMANTDAVIRSRYLETGLFRWPTLPALDRTCISLRGSVGMALRQRGIKLRL